MDFIELVKLAIDFVLHMNKYLPDLIAWAGIWTYLILFGVIFMETGFVVTPFLPGDSLLFAAGATAAAVGHILDVKLLYVLLAIAAILGDTVNYWIGHYIGPKVFTSNSRFLKKEYLDRTQAFYDKHGGKTIFLARFVPIVRTFAPFVAGVGRMRYSYFLTYNVVGGLVWTGLFLFAGYIIGNQEIVERNFSLVIIGIVLISLVPAIVELVRNRKKPEMNPAEKLDPAE